MPGRGKSTSHPIALVVAVADNGVIGRDGGLPWRLPGDLKYFKRVTMGKPLVMGRKTWESLPKKPLPGRPNLVVTRQNGYEAEGAEVFADLWSALEQADRHVAGADVEDPEISVIGGADIFRACLPFADRLYLTEVHAEPDGDVLFPEFDREDWREISRDSVSVGDDGAPAHDFVVLERP